MMRRKGSSACKPKRQENSSPLKSSTKWRTVCELMSLPDLVQAKKTQRDKDWPMLRRLVEVNYFANRETPTREQVRFWFLELRTPELLIELAAAPGRAPTQLIG